MYPRKQPLRSGKRDKYGDLRFEPVGGAGDSREQLRECSVREETAGVAEGS